LFRRNKFTCMHAAAKNKLCSTNLYVIYDSKIACPAGPAKFNIHKCEPGSQRRPHEATAGHSPRRRGGGSTLAEFLGLLSHGAAMNPGVRQPLPEHTPCRQQHTKTEEHVPVCQAIGHHTHLDGCALAQCTTERRFRVVLAEVGPLDHF
jgi:hypothetical protein